MIPEIRRIETFPHPAIVIGHDLVTVIDITTTGNVEVGHDRDMITIAIMTRNVVEMILMIMEFDGMTGTPIAAHLDLDRR
jgi:hypothetical protein